MRCSDGRVPKGDDEINILCDEFAGQRGRSLVAALSPNEQEADVAPFFPTDRLHVAPERFSKGLGILWIGPQHPDHGQASLLRPRRKAQRDQLPDWRLRSWRTYRKRVRTALLRIWLRL